MQFFGLPVSTLSLRLVARFEETRFSVILCALLVLLPSVPSLGAVLAVIFLVVLRISSLRFREILTIPTVTSLVFVGPPPLSCSLLGPEFSFLSLDDLLRSSVLFGLASFHLRYSAKEALSRPLCSSPCHGPETFFPPSPSGVEEL